MENRFDDLTKALAEGIPRRQALRRLAGVFGGALLGALTFGGFAKADQGGCPQGTFRCKGGGSKLCCPVGTTCCGSACCPVGTPCCGGVCCPGICDVSTIPATCTIGIL
jgi:hypothetical protein